MAAVAVNGKMLCFSLKKKIVVATQKQLDVWYHPKQDNTNVCT